MAKKRLSIAGMRKDLLNIKDAGFNAIRIEPHGNFTDLEFVASAKKQVEEVTTWSKNYDIPRRKLPDELRSRH